MDIIRWSTAKSDWLILFFKIMSGSYSKTEYTEQQTISHLSGSKNIKFEKTLSTEFRHNTSTQLRETFVQCRSLFLHLSGHELIGKGLQQFGFLSIGPHKVCFSGWSRLALQLNPSPFLFRFLLFLIIFLHTFQEVISALRVLNMLDTHINSLGKNLALVCLQWCQQHAG